MNASQTTILPGHKITAAVLDLIRESKDFVVLVTAYLKPWVHLEHAIKAAVANKVQIHCIIREPDGSSRERSKARGEIEGLERLGVVVHRLERLHAKVYLNESTAIVTSFNLVSESQNSLEMGMLTTDPTLVEECFSFLLQYCPEIGAVRRSPDAIKIVEEPEPASAREITGKGFCIGCGSDTHPFDLAKPLCRTCYGRTKRATDYTSLLNRVCHSCGTSNKSTVERPLCWTCYKKSSESIRAS